MTPSQITYHLLTAGILRIYIWGKPIYVVCEMIFSARSSMFCIWDIS